MRLGMMADVLLAEKMARTEFKDVWVDGKRIQVVVVGKWRWIR